MSDSQDFGKVQKLLEDMVASLLITKPDDPVPYVVQFLQEVKGTHKAALSKDERIELSQLREEHQKLKDKK